MRLFVVMVAVSLRMFEVLARNVDVGRTRFNAIYHQIGYSHCNSKSSLNQVLSKGPGGKLHPSDTVFYGSCYHRQSRYNCDCYIGDRNINGGCASLETLAAKHGIRNKCFGSSSHSSHSSSSHSSSLRGHCAGSLFSKSSTWCKEAKSVGLSVDQQKKVKISHGEWIYNGKHTGVGKGSQNSRCDNNRFVCAGYGQTYGSGTQQLMELKQAIAHGGHHPDSPVGFWTAHQAKNCAKHCSQGVAGAVTCSTGYCDPHSKPRPKKCKKTPPCEYGEWIQYEPTGCTTTCGARHGGGKPGAVQCPADR